MKKRKASTVILYHFTRADQLASIKRQGLLPQPGDHMTAGIEHVWLTAQPDLSLTEREAQWLFEHGGLHNKIPVEENGRFRFVPPRAGLFTYGWEDGRFFGGVRKFVGRGKPLMRLTVRIRNNDPRLHRYATWRGRPHGDGFDLRSLPYARLWYVYQGAIAPDRIIEIAKATPEAASQWKRSAA